MSDLSAMPSPWLDGTLTADKKHSVLWELTRGCPYSCAYCYEAKGNKAIRYIPQERFEAELALFLQKKVPYVFVLDPTFNSDNKRAIDILDAIKKESELLPERSDTHWHFEVRSELLNRHQAQCFAKIGASLQIGLQTVNPKAAALIGRGNFNRGQFESKIKILTDADVSFGLDLIYGLPKDTFLDYKKGLDFSLSLYPNNLDMFRLSVLPDTVLWDRAASLGLHAKTEAPYEVISTPDFSAADLDAAEKLSLAADRFYNKGRAVAWFNQVLYPLKMKPSVFLEGFISQDGDIEKAQLTYLEAVYTKAKKRYLLPAVHDIVCLNGACGRALVDGMSTDITINYDPQVAMGAVDIESTATFCKQSPVKVRVQPGKFEPELLLL
jgi:radical SAM superfamily enzyme YgiQ (UPF0313 family)